MMNPIISNELNLFAQELQYFLSPIVLQDIAKQIGFVQRSSKYQANELISRKSTNELRALIVFTSLAD
ncbi:hypothetical protein ABEY59_25745 [Bacillus albus]|uniref:hypothetical protein n=2 Tax=Bacillus albus TaxID=2026189 RepID=UPI003D21A153